MQADEERLDLEVVRPDAVERRERAVQHVIAAAKLAHALDREEIGRLLDDADHLGAAPRVGAQRTRITLREREAHRAEPRLVLHREQRLGQRLGVLALAAQDVERQPRGRLLADPGQARQLLRSDALIEGGLRHAPPQPSPGIGKPAGDLLHLLGDHASAPPGAPRSPPRRRGPAASRGPALEQRRLDVHAQHLEPSVDDRGHHAAAGAALDGPRRDLVLHRR